MAATHSFHGLEIALRSFSGARSLRIVHPAGQIIADHRHDWPLLTLPMLGGYQEECDDEVTDVSGPSVVLHPAGRCHANCIHETGMETFSIEFDPQWLLINPALVDRSYYWIGGAIPLASRSLARLWADPRSTECELVSATAAFLNQALTLKPAQRPHWLSFVREQLEVDGRRATNQIAGRLGMHPRWLAHAYRRAMGEGLHDTVVRLRCEQAAHLLRSTDHAIAEIAADAGFCDQSHLNRALRRLTGRTPAQIRGEREWLAQLATAA